MRHGRPIRDARVKDTVDPGIAYNISFTEWEAANAAGLSLWKWEQDEYPKNFKVKVIAWYNLRNLVEMHGESAKAEALVRKNK